MKTGIKEEIWPCLSASTQWKLPFATFPTNGLHICQEGKLYVE